MNNESRKVILRNFTWYPHAFVCEKPTRWMKKTKPNENNENLFPVPWWIEVCVAYAWTELLATSWMLYWFINFQGTFWRYSHNAELVHKVSRKENIFSAPLNCFITAQRNLKDTSKDWEACNKRKFSLLIHLLSFIKVNRISSLKTNEIFAFISERK